MDGKHRLLSEIRAANMAKKNKKNPTSYVKRAEICRVDLLLIITVLLFKIIDQRETLCARVVPAPLIPVPSVQDAKGVYG